MVGQYRAFHQFEEHVGNVGANAVTVQCVAAALINDLTLRIHHIIVFEQALSNAEVVFFDLFLSTLDGLGDHRMLNDVAFHMAQPVHHL